MYYPYLRGRQNELLAVRGFSETLSGAAPKVSPVIEPVRSDFGGLKRMLKSIEGTGMQCTVILNPEYGDLKGKGYINLSDIAGDLASATSCCRPAYIVNDIGKIKKDIEGKGYSEVVLIAPKGVSVDDDAFNKLVSLLNVSKVITSPSSRSIIREAKETGKEIIELEEKFIAQSNNAGYAETCDEEFTQECFFFDENRMFNGFSDYTVLPNEFREGGMLPKVVAIHLTYQKSKDKVNVRHFCSTIEADYKSNVQGKFAEAAADAVAFFNDRAERGAAIQALSDCVEEHKYPGLGVIKKWSVLHHMELMQKILSARQV